MLRNVKISVDTAQPIANVKHMSRKHSKHIRKPMPPATRIQEAARQRIIDSFTPDQVEEGEQEWHADPADDTWDWAGPDERDQRLWEIK